MSKLVTEIIEIYIGVNLIIVGAITGQPELIILGVSLVVAGIAMVLTPGPLTGLAATTRNPIKNWDVIYGRAKLGGTVVYMGSFGDDSKYLDIVCILASHACQSVDALCLDNQRVLLDSNGCSFTPDNNSVSLNSITRVGDVVTYITSSPMDIQSGDYILLHDIEGDDTLNGKFIVEQINSTTFRVVNGGAPATVTSSGYAKPQFPDYRAKIHMEVLLGNHSATFPGMLFGTPYDGDPGNLVQNPENPWNSTCLNLGKTSVFLRFHYNDEVFTGGLPQISFRVSGKNDLYDPRDGSHGYTENAALCIADYLSNSYGFKAKYGTEIPTDALINSANVCDEPVELAAGGTEPRYTCNGTFDLDLKRGDVLSNMLSCCAGRLTYTGGRFVIHPGVWVAPDAGATLSLAQAAGPFEWKGPSLTTLFNGCKGRYISPTQNWVEGDFPQYAQDDTHGYTNGPAGFQHDANLAADGGDRRALEISLPFTISSSMAQRLAKIALLRSRFGGSGTFAFNLAMYKLAALDTCKFNLPYFGWREKLLEITSHRFAFQKGENDVPVLGAELELRETDPSIYEWSVAEELVPEGVRIGNAFPIVTEFTHTLGAIKPAGAAQVFLDASIFNYATMASRGSSTVFLDSNFDGLSGFGSATAAFAGTIAATGTTAGSGTAAFASPVLTSLSSAGVGTGTLAAIILASLEADGAASAALTGTRF